MWSLERKPSNGGSERKFLLSEFGFRDENHRTISQVLLPVTIYTHEQMFILMNVKKTKTKVTEKQLDGKQNK